MNNAMNATTTAALNARSRRMQQRGVAAADAADAARRILDNARRIDWIGERETGDYGRAANAPHAPVGERVLRHCVNVFYRGYGPLPV